MQTYSLNLIRLLSENAFEGILLIDSNGIIRFVNPSAVKMFRYTPEELEGQAISTLTNQLDENNFIIENLDVFSWNSFASSSCSYDRNFIFFHFYNHLMLMRLITNPNIFHLQNNYL